jgi:hypothetical protein
MPASSMRLSSSSEMSRFTTAMPRALSPAALMPSIVAVLSVP